MPAAMSGGEWLPLFPLPVALLPGMHLPLHIFEERYKQMIGDCLRGGEPFGIVLNRPAGAVQTGCSAEIVAVLRAYDDGRLDIVTRGLKRFRVGGIDAARPYLMAEVEWLADDGAAPDPLVSEASALYRDLLGFHGNALLPDSGRAEPLSFQLAASELFRPADRQALLEAADEAERLTRVRDTLRSLKPVLVRIGGNGHPA